jgi:hypothetical protein
MGVWLGDDVIMQDSPTWLHCWLVISHMKIPQVTKITWGFSMKSFSHAKVHVGLHVKCPLLLSDFNEKWNMSANFSKSAQYKI